MGIFIKQFYDSYCSIISIETLKLSVKNLQLVEIILLLFIFLSFPITRRRSPLRKSIQTSPILSSFSSRLLFSAFFRQDCDWEIIQRFCLVFVLTLPVFTWCDRPDCLAFCCCILPAHSDSICQLLLWVFLGPCSLTSLVCVCVRACVCECVLFLLRFSTRQLIHFHCLLCFYFRWRSAQFWLSCVMQRWFNYHHHQHQHQLISIHCEWVAQN